MKSLAQRHETIVQLLLQPILSSPKAAMGVFDTIQLPIRPVVVKPESPLARHAAPVKDQLVVPGLTSLCQLFVDTARAAKAKTLTVDELGTIVACMTAFAKAVFEQKFVRFNTPSRNDLLNEVMTTRQVRVIGESGELEYRKEAAPFRAAQLAIRESYPGAWENPTANETARNEETLDLPF